MKQGANNSPQLIMDFLLGAEIFMFFLKCLTYCLENWDGGPCDKGQKLTAVKVSYKEICLICSNNSSHIFLFSLPQIVKNFHRNSAFSNNYFIFFVAAGLRQAFIISFHLSFQRQLTDSKTNCFLYLLVINENFSYKLFSVSVILFCSTLFQAHGRYDSASNFSSLGQYFQFFKQVLKLTSSD